MFLYAQEGLEEGEKRGEDEEKERSLHVFSDSCMNLVRESISFYYIGDINSRHLLIKFTVMEFLITGNLNKFRGRFLFIKF